MREGKVITVHAAVVSTVVAAGLFVSGFLLGKESVDAEWHIGTAHVGGTSPINDEPVVASIETDDWTYGFRGHVHWIDEGGSLHTNGWPLCLDGTAQDVPMRFAATEVELDGTYWREVVMVDCSYR